MRYVVVFSTILYLLFATAAAAFDTPESMNQSLLTFSECRNYLNNNCGSLPPSVKRAMDACAITEKTHDCENLAEKNPDLKDQIISCQPEEFCKQQMVPALEQALSCWKGVKGGVIDPFVSLAEAIGGAWDSSQKARAENRVFLEQCDLACKKNLIKDVPYYARLSDAKLESLSAESLQNAANQDQLITKTANANFSTYLPKKSAKTANPDEQKKKLSELWKSAEASVKEKYHQYACYNPEAQQELVCYAFASLLDPTIVVGKSLKVYKAVRLMKALEKETAAAGGAAKEAGYLSRIYSREEFTKAYLHYSPTTKEQNLQWMALASDSIPNKNIKFFDVENSAMKSLNDTIKDKNLVTSLTNYHKALLDEKTKALFNQLKKDSPDLELIEYSDFKASRFAFKGKVPADLEKRLDGVLQETNKEFSEYLAKNKILKSTDKPQEWFRAGYGETADQATLASRFSRQSTENSVKSYGSAEMKQTLHQKLESTETLRSNLQRDLSSTSMLEGSAKKTLNSDALDILRKNSDDLPKAQADLKNRFGLDELPLSTVEKMQSYAKSVDEFSPGIHIAERQVATLDEAVYGGLSADMAGMGSKNLSATAKALSNSKNLDEVLQQTRTAEKTVTKEFNQQKKVFQEVLTDVVGADRIKTVCSGDDCIAIPKQVLVDKEKQQILQKLSDAGYSSQFRLAFVPENVADVAARNQLSVHGESIEKALRKSLADKMDPNKLKGLIFGVDMKTSTLNEGAVKLMTAAHSEVRLTASEQKLIQENFKKALQQFNTDQFVQNGHVGTYQVWNP